MEGEDRRVGGESSSHLISDCPPRGILPKALSILYFGTNHRETFKMSFFKAKKGGAAASKEEMRHRKEVKRQKKTKKKENKQA